MCIYTAEGLKEIFMDTDSLILERRKDLSNIDWTHHNAVTSFSLMGFLCLLPTVFYCVLKKYSDRLAESTVKARIWNLYADLSMFERERKISYYPVFLAKRIVFVMIPSLCFWGPFAQIQCVIMLTYAYMVFYAGRKPHNDKKRIHLEICNEACFMIMNYHMITFSNFNTDPEAQFYMGYSFIVFTCFMVLINLVYLMTQQLKLWKNLKRMKVIKAEKIYEAAVYKEKLDVAKSKVVEFMVSDI
jgi:hypothetical protein